MNAITTRVLACTLYVVVGSDLLILDKLSVVGMTVVAVK